jgi:hypothetical protein
MNPPRASHAGRCLAIAAAVVCCAAAIAACASAGHGNAGGGGSTNASTPNPAAVAVSRCMRRHGVTHFPDPEVGPGGQGLSIAETPGGETITVDGTSFSGPVFQAAAKTCKLGPGARSRGISEAQKQGILASARCMRRHGVPDFPDPTFGPHGGVLTPTSGVNRNSPAFVAADRACADVGTPIPGGG